MQQQTIKKFLLISGVVAIAVFALKIKGTKQSEVRIDELTNIHKDPAKDKQRNPHSPVTSMTLEEWEEKVRLADADGMKGLMEQALMIGDADLQHAVVVSILDKWLLVDAKGFIKYLNGLEVNGAEDSMAVLASAIQESLTKLTEDQAASDDILLVVERLISYLASHDPEKALEWANRYLLDDAKDSALVAIARGLARKNIDAGVKVAEGIQSPLRRSQALAAVGVIWAGKDAEGALKWAVSLRNPAERALTLNSVLLVTSQQQLSDAASSLKEQAHLITEQYLRERNAELASRGLSEADLANDPETYKDMLASGGISAPSSPDVELMADAGKVIGAKLGAQDAGKAVDWAESLDGDYLKLKSLSGVLDGWAKENPQAALAYVKENYPNNNDLVSSVYESWAAVDPAAAAKGTSLIADPAESALALDTVVKIWSSKGDFTEVSDFVSQLPASQNMDSVKYTLATAMSYTQPEAAWQLAQSITNESAQYRALKSAFSVMVIQDPGKASGVLSGSNLSPTTTERLGEMVAAVVGQ